MFSTRLTSLRKANKLTQEELSKRLSTFTGKKITRTAIAQWERGVRHPNDVQIMNDIANYFEVTTDYMLGNSDEIRDTIEISDDKFIEEFEGKFTLNGIKLSKYEIKSMVKIVKTIRKMG
jgi:transcriptional regulator with XRE-family HTH domain